nr:uncharacterized protein LOC109731168 [Microcebus murinus]
MGDAADLKATDGVQKEEKGGSEFTPEHQGEDDECDLVPEEDHKTQELPQERVKETGGRRTPWPTCAISGRPHTPRTPQGPPGQTWRPPRPKRPRGPGHVGLTQVSEAAWLTLIGGGAVVRSAKRRSQHPSQVEIQERITARGHIPDNEGQEGGFNEGRAGPPLAQQPLGLQAAPIPLGLSCAPQPRSLPPIGCGGAAHEGHAPDKILQCQQSRKT